MESLTTLSVINTRFCSPNSPSSSSINVKKNRPCHRRFRITASSPREGYELDKWDHMELKFGKLLGEDPKLTLYKIMAKKANPDVSYLEVEKEFYQKKGKIDESMLNIAIDLSAKGQTSDTPRDKNMSLSRPVMNNGVRRQTTSGLNLSRPIFNKGIKATFDLNLSRPSMNKGNKTTQPIEKNHLLSDAEKDNASIVSLRKPNLAHEDELESDKRSKLKIKPNLVLKMRKDKVEDLSDLSPLKKPEMTKKPSITEVENKPLVKPVETMRKDRVEDLSDISPLKKPEAIKKPSVTNVENNSLVKPVESMRKDRVEDLSDLSPLKKPEVINKPSVTDVENKRMVKPVESMRKTRVEDLSDLSPIKKPEAITKPSITDVENNSTIKPVESMSSEDLQDKPKMNDLVNARELSGGIKDSVSESLEITQLNIGLQAIERDTISIDDEVSSKFSNEKSVAGISVMSPQASLQGRPQRMEAVVKEISQPIEKDSFNVNEGAPEFHSERQVMVSAEQEEREAIDWRRAEHLLLTGERTEVEVVSCSSRGFIVSFGSLAGFLPYRNLGAKWKFLAFESWLRQKGLDPLLYRQNMGTLGSYDKSTVIESDKSQAVDGKKDEQTLISRLKFIDLLEEYEKEKTMFLSSFIGQITKVSVLMVERNSRRLMFSGRTKEKQEVVEKKKSLMAKLSVGDVVKCCVTKITYFGIFVEVEGVPALIHQTEISWDATLDPSAYYKIGQIIEAKVHQLDFALGRISLSLKEIMPDPLMETLESVVGDHTSLEGNLEATQTDIEPWEDVESLIEELQQINDIQNVSKGRFFTSPGLAPTFQVYMGSVFDNQYKLLARYGDMVQEVIVQTDLNKEEMKAAILTCTNRVQ